MARASSSARIARPLWRSAEPLSPTRPLTRGTGASAVTRSAATDRRTLEPFACCDRALRPPLGAIPAATPSPPPGRPRALEESCEAHEHEYPTRIDLGRQRPSRGAGAPPEVTVLGARRDEERATIRLHGHPDRLGADLLIRLMPLLDSHGGRVVLLGPPGLLPAKLRRIGTGKPPAPAQPSACRQRRNPPLLVLEAVRSDRSPPGSEPTQVQVAPDDVARVA